ncbi:hypothetical protein HAX54_032369, partial [Datura stramonium]|nr:hypothetical protein [Datura stramonium]
TQFLEAMTENGGSFHSNGVAATNGGLQTNYGMSTLQTPLDINHPLYLTTSD